ncbi:hypothetical protein [Mycetocola lacteus]|uniref:hypothetical protein n=1 Tax=Mycetocola lacteus TaxID=76637 RepID=UPI0015FEC089|nr:hypothetical protein [Mycetocola lacteus]
MSGPFTLIGDPAAEACGPDGCAIPVDHPARTSAVELDATAPTAESALPQAD